MATQIKLHALDMDRPLMGSTECVITLEEK